MHASMSTIPPRHLVSQDFYLSRVHSNNSFLEKSEHELEKMNKRDAKIGVLIIVLSILVGLLSVYTMVISKFMPVCWSLQSYWTTTKLCKLTVVLDYYEAMQTYSRIGLL